MRKMKGGQRQGKLHKVDEKDHGQCKLHKVVEKEQKQPEKVISLYLAEFIN